jgi:hypothetical protein
MRKDAVGTVGSQTSTSRWPVGLSSAAQLLGELAVGIVAGAPGVLAYRSALVAAAQQVETTLPNSIAAGHGETISGKPTQRQLDRVAAG